MDKKREHDKMIDIYEADLEDYFKYLLERVNSFLNKRTDTTQERHSQRIYRINKKAS